MKYRKLVKEHIETKYEESKTLCDFCGRDLETVRESWEYNDIELHAKIGSVYPEGDFRQGYRLDCCKECFIDKVVPAIETLGVKWQEYDPEEAYVSSTFGDYYKDESPDNGTKVNDLAKSESGDDDD